MHAYYIFAGNSKDGQQMPQPAPAQDATTAPTTTVDGILGNDLLCHCHTTNACIRSVACYIVIRGNVNREAMPRSLSRAMHVLGCNATVTFLKKYRVGQKNRPPTLFCLYYCSICLDAQITHPVNWNSVVHILKPKLNLYVRSSFKILQQSQSTPNIIMSQWQNTRAICVLVSLCPITTSYSTQKLADSQVNSCSVCPPWARITACNLGRHWSTALFMNCWSRLAQQVRTRFLRSTKLTIWLTTSC